MRYRHTFVLIAPRPRPGFSVFRNQLMSPELYELIRNYVVEHLRHKKWELFSHYPRVILCTPTEDYTNQIHQFILRLICWKCSPRYDRWTLQVRNFHVGGCDHSRSEFWPDIQNIHAVVEPSHRQYLRNTAAWLHGEYRPNKKRKPRNNRRGGNRSRTFRRRR